MRRSTRALVSLSAAAVLSVGSLHPSGDSGPPVTVAATPIKQLIGQKLMVAMSGITPSAGILGRIERGEIGGVILYGANIGTPAELVSLTRKLQQAAAGGGQPPLLIATDQEGGQVKRVSWAPPTLSPPQMGARASASTASAQGKATGRMLACAGINHDLAPVADVPTSTSSFMYLQGRTWSFDASLTATLSDAFATGLQAGSALATMKHFPGIGMATRTTDSNVVTITASKSALAPGLRPYKKAIAHGTGLIMLSNATYPAYDGANAAGWSHAISVDLLRTTLGFTGVSITDSLNGIAAARGVSVGSLAVKAARAGTDMILLTGTESGSSAAFASLVQAAQNGAIPLSRLTASYNRITALKSSMPGPITDTTPPTVAAPVSRLYSGATLGSSSTPVRTTWSATDPCRIARYWLDRRTNGGAWTRQGLASWTTTSVAQSLSFGSAYDYAALAMDGASNRSGRVAGPTFAVRRVEEASVDVTYRGTWHGVSSTSASGGTLRYSTAAGASARYTFSGSAVSWVASLGPNRGAAAVYIDGAYVKTVNLYSTADQPRKVVFARNWDQSGTHTIRIVNKATEGHRRVDVDAFVRLRKS